MAIWLPKPLKTARLCLRATQRGDEDWIIGLFTDAEVRKYVGGAMSLEDARASVILSGEWWGHFAIVDRESKQAIGSVSFSHRNGPWEINYSLRRDSWGHGLASEAAKAALCWFFNETDEKQVSAVTQAANERSCRLLEKMGAKLTDSFMYREVLQRRYVFERL